jgi:adhesin/invasin
MIGTRMVRHLFLTILSYMILVSCSGPSSPIVESSSLDSLTFSIVSGNGQFAPLNSNFTDPLVVKISGASDVSGIPVFFQLSSTSAAASLVPVTVLSDSDGLAQVSLSSLGDSSTVTVEVSLPQASINKVLTFNLFVNGNSINWDVSDSTGAAATAGTPFTLNIKAFKSGSVVDTDFTGSKALSFSTTATSSPDATAPSLPANTTYTFTNGVIDTPPSVTLYNTSETPTVTVSGSGLSSGSTSAITVTPNVIDAVSALDADSCAGVPVGTRNASATVQLTFYAYSYDEFGNCISGITGNWTKSFSDPQLSFDSSVTATHSIDLTPIIDGQTGTVTLDDGTRNYVSTLSIFDGVADHFLVTGLDSDGNYSMSAGTTYTVRVEARDAFGNTSGSYTGVKSLAWSSTATSIVPISALGFVTTAPVVPSDTNYTFSNGTLTSPSPSVMFAKSSESPTISLYDTSTGGSYAAATLKATTANITVNSGVVNKAIIRSQALGAGSDAATFDATATTRTTDDTYNLYCATYDSFGNYLTDSTTADWSFTGAFVSGDFSPGVTNQSTVVVSPSVSGTGGTITCDEGSGITDGSGSFTMLAGVPFRFAVDVGTGEATAATKTAGAAFNATVNLYDNDGNLCTNYTNASYDIIANYLGTTSLNPIAPSNITISAAFDNAQIETVDGNSRTTTLNISNGTATLTNMLLINDTNNSDEVKLQIVDNESSPSIQTATSGDISVTNSTTLAHLSIQDTAGAAGSPVTTASITTDNTRNLHAAGYDASGNFISDQLVDWTTTAPSGSCGAGDLSSGDANPLTAGSFSIYNPSQLGSCILTGALGAVSGSTGSITASGGGHANFTVAKVDGTTAVTAGQSFSIRITARDADGNRLLSYAPDGTYNYTLTHTNPTSPEGTVAMSLSLSRTDFSFGEAIISGIQVYDDAAFTITATQTAPSVRSGTSASITVSAGSLHHYATTNTAGSPVADGTTPFSIDVESRDEWGNPTTTGIGANVSLTALRVSDEATVDVIGNGSALTFGAASVTYSNLTYRVSHVFKVVATDTNSVTTPSTLQDTVTVAPDAAGISSYVIDTFSTTAPVAGSTFTSKITSKDVQGNTITGLDATLGGYTFTVTSTASNSEYGSSASYHATTIPFSSGISNDINYTLYNDETILGTNITLGDGNGHVGNAGSNNIVVQAAALNHYANDITAPVSIDADGSTTFSATITARDLYGNIVTGATDVDLGVNHTAGGSAGTLGGSSQNINMSSGTTTISNLTYTAAGTMELTISDGSISENAARSVDYTFAATIGTLDHYDMSFTGPATAGTAFDVVITAKDSSNNTITNLDTTLNAQTYTWTSGLNNSPESSTPTPSAGGFSATANGGVAFSSGVATFKATFVNAETLATAGLVLTDNNAVTATSTGGLTINADAATHLAVSGATTGTADNSTTYTATIESRDAYGNIQGTGNAADNILNLDVTRVSGVTTTGTLGGTTALTGISTTGTVTISDLIYNVAHTTKFSVTGSPSVPVTSTLSENVTWAFDTTTINSYSLTRSESTKVAGVSTNFTLSALDAAGNIIIGEDTALNALTFNYSLNANVDAPNGTATGTTDGSPGNATTLSFTSGQATIPFAFYNITNNLSASDITVTDISNSINTNNTQTMAITSASASYFETASAGTFPVSASGAAQSTADVQISQFDQYGNLTTGAGSSNYLTHSKISGYGGTNGTLMGCVDAPCTGGRFNITAMNMDFNSNSQITVYDLSYDVGNIVEIIANNGSGVTTSSANAENLSFVSVKETIASYELRRAAATAAVNASTSWGITAKDAAGNIMSGTTEDGVLAALQHAITDVSGSSLMDGPENTSVSLPAAANLTWTSGVTSISGLRFYNTTNDVAIGYLRVSDDQTAITGDNLDAMTITSGAAHHLHTTTSGGDFSGTMFATGTRYNDTQINVTLYDTYGNLTTGINNVNVNPIYRSGYGTTAGTFKACATDGCVTPVDTTSINLDFSSIDTISLYDISYDVGVEIDLQATDGSITTSDGDATNFTWTSNSSTLTSYILSPNVTTIDADSAMSWTITARDAALNNMSGTTEKAVLEAMAHAITDTTGTSMNGPSSGTVSIPASASLTWTSGQATIAGLKFYNATNNVQVGYLQVADDTTAISATNAFGSTVTVNPKAVGDHFEITGNNLGALAADGTDQTTSDLTITLYDEYGNVNDNTTTTNASIGLSRLSGYATNGVLKVCSADGCGAPVDVTTLTPSFNGSSSVTYYDLNYTVANDVEILASHGSVTSNTSSGDSIDLNWIANKATVTSYTLDLAPTTASAGDTITATLTAFDIAGNLIASDDSILDTINFNFNTSANNDGPTAGLVDSDDPTNGTIVSNGTNFSSGVASLSYKFYSDRTVLATEVNITDTDNSISKNADNTVNVGFDTKSQLVFSTQPSSTVVAGVDLATQPVVQVRDTYGNLVTSAVDSVTLTDWTTSDCSTSAGSGSLNASANPVSAAGGITTYAGVDHETAGSTYLKADNGSFSTCSSLITVSSAAPSTATSNITGTGSVIANGVATSTVTITLLDVYSNPIVGTTPTFNATDTGTTNAYTGCSATNASGVSTCTMTSTKAEVKTLSIATPIVDSGGTVTFVAGAEAAATSTITGTGTVIANGVATSTVTITLLDAFSNPVAGTTPTFSATDTGTTNAYAGCSATNVSGVSTCTMTSTKAEVKTLSIATPVSKADGTVTFVSGAEAAATSTITGTGTVIANGVATSTVTITLLDAFSNPVSGATPTFSATNTGTTNAYAGCSVANASGVSTCTMTSTKAEVKTLSIATPVSKADGTVTFVSGAEAAATSTITGTSSITADGSATSTVTITLLDAFSNPVAGTTPTFSATDTGTTNVYVGCSVANASGVSTCTMTSTKAEVKTLSIATPVSKADGTVTFVPDVATTGNSNITGTSSITADGSATSTITITLIDANSNPLVGTTPTFSATDTGTTNAYAGCLATNASGVSTCTMTSTKAEIKTLSIATPIADVGGTVTFVADVATTGNSSITGTGSVIANGVATSTITVTLVDANSNPLVGTTPTFSATDTGTTNAYAACSAANASGVSTCTMTSTKAEVKTLSIATPIADVGGTVTFVAGAEAAATSTITGTGTVIANGVATSTVTITLLDAFSNPVAGATPTFSATNTGTTNSYAGCSVANASGVSTCTMTSTKAEVKTLSIATPVSKADGTVTFVSGAEAAATSTITGTGTVIANGVATSTVTITLLDAFSNPVSGATPTFSATNTGTTNSYAGCSVANASGVSTCTMTSTKAEVKTLSIATPVSKADGTVTFVAGAEAAATSTITGTGTVIANGAATSTVTITLLDAFSNPVAGATPTFSATDTGTTNAYAGCSVANASGVSTCTMTSTKAEVKTLSIATPVSKADGNVTFVAGAVAVIIYTQEPTNTNAGSSIGPSIVINLNDANGNLTSSTDNVTLSIGTDGNAGTVLGGTLTRAAVSGQATFNDITLNKIGTGFILLATHSADSESSASFNIKTTLSLNSGTTSLGSFNTDTNTILAIENTGTATSGVIGVSLNQLTGIGNWAMGTDNCDTTTLTSGGNCTIQVWFNGATGTGGNVASTADLTITTANGESLVISLDATKIP